MKKEIRLSGSGGQGLVLAGIILSEAAILDRKKVLQSQSYGPESRGGSSRSDVIISDDTIYYPRAVDLDVLLCLTQEAADKFISDLKTNGYLIYDSSLIKVNPIDGDAIGVPFSEYAIEKFKTTIVTNIISLAFLCRITEIVSLTSLKKAIKERVKERYVEMNMKAVKLGVHLAEDYLKESK